MTATNLEGKSLLVYFEEKQAQFWGSVRGRLDTVKLNVEKNRRLIGCVGLLAVGAICCGAGAFGYSLVGGEAANSIGGVVEGTQTGVLRTVAAVRTAIELAKSVQPIINTVSASETAPPGVTIGGFDIDTAWPGELPFNRDRLNSTASSRWQKIIESLKGDYQVRDVLKGANSLLTSLINRPKGDVFVADPEQESGLGHTIEDFDHYTSADLLLSKKDTKVNEFGYFNPDTGLHTVGIYGAMTDKDAVAFLVAMRIEYAKDTTAFFNTISGEVMTVEQVMANDELVARILATQEKIYFQTQKRGLGLSQGEIDRRAAGIDTSSQIPEAARREDQIQVCEYEMVMKDGILRLQQVQDIHQVDHVVDGDDTLPEADVDEEEIFIAAYYSQLTEEEDFDAFNDRSFTSSVVGSEGALSGQQMVACAEDIQVVQEVVETPTGTAFVISTQVVAPSPVPQPSPVVTPSITETPHFVITNTPPVVFTQTPFPTDTPSFEASATMQNPEPGPTEGIPASAAPTEGAPIEDTVAPPATSSAPVNTPPVAVPSAQIP